MKLLIVGAGSAIAQETAKCFAKDGAEMFLVARDAEKLAAIRQDLEVRGAKRITTYTLDLDDLSRHPDLIRAAVDALGGLDAVLIAHGTLPDQKAVQDDVEKVMAAFTTNALSYLSLLTLLAPHFEAQRRGCIAAITSVAGDRGRGSNYVYGAAKGAVNIYLSGLRARLSKSGVSVVTVKPGFVDTPMTAHLKKNLLYAKPETVGKRIYTAMLKGQDVVYTPGFWWAIMWVIKHIPEMIFKKLPL